jgi:hypothetical protein
MDRLYFSILTYKRQDLWNEAAEDEVLVCVSFLSATLSEKSLTLRRIQRDIVKNVHTSWCAVPLFSQDLNEISIFSKDFRKIFKYQIHFK